MQNPRVFIAFVGETALVMTQEDSHLIRHTGAVPAEYVHVEDLPRRPEMSQVGGSGECFQGMRRRLDISDWCRDYSDTRCWKTYRARQHRSRAVA